MLATGRGPLRRVWVAAQFVFLRALAGWLRLGTRSASVYLRRSAVSGDYVFGVSDVDLALIAPRATDVERARRRHERLCALLPPLRDFLDLGTYEEAALGRAVGSSILTYPDGSAYWSNAEPGAELWLLKRPGIHRPLADWRRLAGRDRRPHVGEYGAQERRIAGWLELGVWWSYAVTAARRGGEPDARSCAKHVAETARIGLWLEHGEEARSRGEALRTALLHLPEEAPALELALHQLEAPPGSPGRLDDVLPFMVRQSERIARLLAAEVNGAGATAVRLVGGDPAELVLAPGALDQVSRPLPLVDWVARAASWLPDEAFGVMGLDPTRAADLCAAARPGGGVEPALEADGLLIFPRGRWGSLRTLQCAVSEPVTFALLEGRAEAGFPEVPGWSARDCARRAVAEQAGWLATMPEAISAELRRDHPDYVAAAPATRALGGLLSATRAALFLESLDAGDPELALSVAAAGRCLATHHPGMRGVYEEAYGHYRTARAGGAEPPPEAVRGLRDAVRRLPTYARG